MNLPPHGTVAIVTERSLPTVACAAGKRILDPRSTGSEIPGGSAGTRDATADSKPNEQNREDLDPGLRLSAGQEPSEHEMQDTTVLDVLDGSGRADLGGHVELGRLARIVFGDDGEFGVRFEAVVEPADIERLGPVEAEFLPALAVFELQGQDAHPGRRLSR